MVQSFTFLHYIFVLVFMLRFTNYFLVNLDDSGTFELHRTFTTDFSPNSKPFCCSSIQEVIFHLKPLYLNVSFLAYIKLTLPWITLSHCTDLTSLVRILFFLEWGQCLSLRKSSSSSSSRLKAKDVSLKTFVVSTLIPQHYIFLLTSVPLENLTSFQEPRTTAFQVKSST